MKKLTTSQHTQLTAEIAARLKQLGILKDGYEITVGITFRKKEPITVKIFSPGPYNRKRDLTLSKFPKALPGVTRKMILAFNSEPLLTVGQVARKLQLNQGKGISQRGTIFRLGDTSLKQLQEILENEGIDFNQMLPLPGPLEKKAIKSCSLDDVIWLAFDPGIDRDTRQLLARCACNEWDTIGNFKENSRNKDYLERLKQGSGGFDFTRIITRLELQIGNMGL